MPASYVRNCTPSQPLAELAAIGPAPVADSVGFAAVESAVKVAEAAPVGRRIEAPLIKAAKVQQKSASPAPVKLAMADVPASKPATVKGTHLVQLGAFSSIANAQAAWNKL